MRLICKAEVTTGDFPLPSDPGNTRSIFMDASRPLFIPVILGTARMGRMSLHAARLVTQEVGKRAGVETELIDIARTSAAHR